MKQELVEKEERRNSWKEWRDLRRWIRDVRREV
jgi:hypothetical protein